MNRFTLSLLTVATAAVTSPAQSPTPGAPDPQGGITWKDLVPKSGLPLRFYGFFRLDAYYNTARMNNVIVPATVNAETKRNDDQFFLDPRLTRFGFDVGPIEVEGTKVSGKLEIDFANFPTGSAESRATPRIRVAYIDIGKGEFGLRVGQDWDVISPLWPAVNHELLMWNAGNLGDRRAQIQGRWVGSKTDLKAALGLTGAINNEDLDTPAGEKDGFDSGMPHIQVRAGWKPGELVEKKPIELGGWGLYGQIQTDTAYGGERRFDTWAAGIDWQLPLFAALTFRGEAWVGENLGDVRGGIGQTINVDPTSPAFGNEVSAAGGFAEVVYAWTAKTRFHVGASLDDPENEDLSLNAPTATVLNPNKRRNQTAYVGTVVDWDSGVRTGLDCIYWQTDYTGADGTNGSSGNAVRVNLYFQLNF